MVTGQANNGIQTFRIPYIQFSMLMLCLKGMKNFVKIGDLRTRRNRGNRMGRGA
ncbi:hypothetical protein B4135_2039 [Caldibacillus debilis]|uniref:Uncharacterized protein n=1 Tax=Caldibacillus debilis TaxID=301148 RepID=A0A150M4U2_9BACI|nr:hypothetical protein B4135_2039 [Caldibacillus debilis]